VPVKPCGPCGPAGPSAPAGPAGPVFPAAPAGPMFPAAPSAPLAPAGPIGPAAPERPCGPIGPWGPESPFGPGGPAGPADRAAAETVGGGGVGALPLPSLGRLSELKRLPPERAFPVSGFTRAIRTRSLQDASVHDASVQDARGRFVVRSCLPWELRFLATTAAGAPRPTARTVADAIARAVKSDRRTTTYEVIQTAHAALPRKGEPGELAAVFGQASE
jgi:hypothetical protein